jgi:hypothetical protein
MPGPADRVTTFNANAWIQASMANAATRPKEAGPTGPATASGAARAAHAEADPIASLSDDELVKQYKQAKADVDRLKRAHKKEFLAIENFPAELKLYQEMRGREATTMYAYEPKEPPPSAINTAIRRALEKFQPLDAELTHRKYQMALRSPN